MPLHTEWVQYGSHKAYLAFPERAAQPLPAVVVIQEVWGVDDHIQDVTRRLAQAGYVAMAPDLFWEGGEPPEALKPERVAEVKAFMTGLHPASWGDVEAREAALAALPDPERARVVESHGAVFASPARMGEFVPALRDAVRHLKTACSASLGQPVASVGFCMGGGLSALLACEEPGLAGAAIFYGSAPPLDRVRNISCPVTGFYGALDARMNAGLPAFAEAMAGAGKAFEYQIYDGAAHAFFNDSRPSYDVRAARDAFARLLTFLRGVL